MEHEVEIRKITGQHDLEKMVDWMYHWWGMRENYERDAIKCYMMHSFQTNKLPQTYGLYLKNVIIGMYQFRNDDLFVRPDIYPWLANVYIDPGYRSGGYGRILLSSVQRNATEAGLKEIYLFTAHIGLYEKFGWEFLEIIDTFLEPKYQRLYRLSL